MRSFLPLLVLVSARWDKLTSSCRMVLTQLRTVSTDESLRLPLHVHT